MVSEYPIAYLIASYEPYKNHSLDKERQEFSFMKPVLDFSKLNAKFITN